MRSSIRFWIAFLATTTLAIGQVQGRRLGEPSSVSSLQDEEQDVSLAEPEPIQVQVHDEQQQQQQHRELWDKDADVFILLDGGDSVSPANFAAQQRALITAIRNTNVVPRDGSVAIGVIQYGGPAPSLAVPMTIVDDDSNPAALNSIVAGINAMTKLAGTANMGAAVNLATASVVPRRKARQVFVLITDELSGPGPDLTDAVHDAKRESWQLDVFSVLCFGNAFTDAQFKAAYNDLLFDGQLVFANTEAEFAQWIAVVGFGYPSNGASIGPPVNPNSVSSSNLAPNVYVTLPSPIFPNTPKVYNQDQVMHFQAYGTDFETGPLATNYINWIIEGLGHVGVGYDLYYEAWRLTTGPHKVLVYGVDPITGQQGPYAQIDIVIRTAGGVNFPTNQAPVVRIDKPTAEQYFDRSDRIKLDAYAIDPEDGELGGGASVQWYIDNKQEPIATGGSSHISKNALTVGRYALSAVATDSRGATSTRFTIFINVCDGNICPRVTTPATPVAGTLPTPVAGTLPVPNTSPVLSIIQPGNLAHFVRDDRIKLEAYAFDADDGELGGGASVQWFLDNNFGEALATGGSSHIKRNTLSTGAHWLTAIATDSRGAQSVPAQIVLIIWPGPNLPSNPVPPNPLPPRPVPPGQPPIANPPNPVDTLTVFSPLGNQVFTTADTVFFAASVTMPGTTILWSFLNGQFRVGPSHAVPASTFGVGSHPIIVTATTLGGAVSSTTVTITVVPMQVTVQPNPSDTLTVDLPTPNQVYRLADSVIFSARVQMPGTTILWSFLRGQFRVGPIHAIAASTFGVGVHPIIVTATTTGGAVSTTVVNIQVLSNNPTPVVTPVNPQPNTPPRVSIVSPDRDDVFENSGMISFSATATDDQEGILSGASVQWFSDLETLPLGVGQRIDVDAGILTLGRHIVTCVATDSFGATGQTSVPIQVTEGPVVTIISPGKGKSFENEDIPLRVDVIQWKGGPVRNNDIIWYALRNGQASWEIIGTGRTPPPTTTARLGPGHYEITVIAETTDGLRGVDSVFIAVDSPSGPGPASVFTPQVLPPRRNPRG